MTLETIAVSLTAVIALSQPTLAQDPASKAPSGDDGQQAFNNACRTCHTLREGDNRLGPNLYKIVGRKVGSLPNYFYSSAMKNADMVWDKGTLDRFIANPDQVVPGHSMTPYGGIASAEDRVKIVTFLEASSGN